MRSIVSRSMQSVRKFGAVLATGSLMLLGGCLERGFFDQTEMVYTQKEPLVVPVLNSLNTGIEEPAEQFGQSEEPTAADLVAEAGDYRISTGDLITVTIADLRGIGADEGRQLRVADSGNISLPRVGQLKIIGLTEPEAEVAVARRYQDMNILVDPQVSVVVIEPRGRTFSIAGAVGRPGQYQIFKSDFRLLDAFVSSADFDVTRGTRGYEYVYVIRKTEGAAPAAAPATEPPADVLKPRTDARPSGDRAQAAYLRLQPAETTAAPATVPTEGGEGRYVIIDGKPVLVGGGPATPEPAAPAAPAEAGAPTPGVAAPGTSDTPAPATADARPFEFNSPTEPTDTRVVRIPIEKLVRGELKYNIIIRPGDLIFVPAPPEGVYYMGGHVARGGVYTLGNGNKVSLMNAIIAAGGLDQVAVPWRTSIVRRLPGENKQIFVTVDLTKIFAGTEPDIYLKKDDNVMVGTQAWAPFLAALRNGFRLTYGFGFLYDRNYYDNNNNN